MRAIVTAILLSVLLQACGSKGALIMPQQKQGVDKQQQSNNNKQD